MPHPKKTEIRLKTQDGIDISANYYNAGFENVLIICPGFMMHKDSRPFSMLSESLNKEFDIIAMDFRGHGKSGGTYTFTSREGLDLKAVIDYSRPRYKSIGIIGFSLGAAVAINEVAKDKAVDRLMAVSAPMEFGEIENKFLNKDVVSSTIKKIELDMLNIRLGNIFLNKSKPIDNVDKISPVPILFVHGKDDTIIEPRHSVSLYEKAKEPKKLVIFEDSLHAEDLFLGNHFNSFISLCTEWFKG